MTQLAYLSPLGSSLSAHLGGTVADIAQSPDRKRVSSALRPWIRTIVHRFAAQGTLGTLGVAASSVQVCVSLCLRAGSAASFELGRAQTLKINAGHAWITVDAEFVNERGAPCACERDIFLSAGERLLVEPGHRLVVEALGGHALQLIFVASDSAA